VPPEYSGDCEWITIVDASDMEVDLDQINVGKCPRKKKKLFRQLVKLVNEQGV
jgi:hypothetical protein